MSSEFSGKCLCGTVIFYGQWDGGKLAACHCGQCRRWSGHIWAGATAKNVEITGPVRWYRSSDFAERGFCSECGSGLFWRGIGETGIDVAPGCVDMPTGIELQRHIFVSDKGDYYDIADGLPQRGQEEA